MPQVDVQWPTEDEDFDAVSGGIGAEPTTAVAEKPKTVRAKVTEPNESLVEEAAPEPQEVSAETDSTDEVSPESSVEQESEMDNGTTTPNEPSTQSAVTPVSPVTTKPEKAVKTAGNNGKARLVVEVVLVLAVIGLGLWAWTLSSDNRDLKKQVAQITANPQDIVQKQTTDLISKVNSLYTLPTGETPTIANVTDASQAKKQSAFFNNAQNGDKVLMYVKAGEAILYRPSTNKIILVAPLTFTNNGSTTNSGAANTSTSTTSTNKTTTTKP